MASSTSRINMSLLFILAASMAMLASSSTTIQPQISTFSDETPRKYPELGDLSTYEQCFTSISECFDEIDLFLRAIARGEQVGTDFRIAPSCCTAILDIHIKCWLLMFPDPFYTPGLQKYCMSHSAPDSGPVTPAISPVSEDVPSPTPAPKSTSD